jgi:hypothetical protein
MQESIITREPESPRTRDRKLVIHGELERESVKYYLERENQIKIDQESERDINGQRVSECE